MKTQSIFITESGKPLVNKDDGFIVYGTIFKGDGVSGLIGSMDEDGNPSVEGSAYTVEEFIDALCIPIADLERYVESRRRRPRHNSIF